MSFGTSFRFLFMTYNMNKITGHIFRTVMGWEQQHVNKLASSLSKSTLFLRTDWSREPEQFCYELYEELSDSKSYFAYHSFVGSTLFDSRNREKKHLDKSRRVYWVRWRWYERSIKVVATSDGVKFSQIWRELDQANDGERFKTLRDRLSKIEGVENYVIFHDWLTSLKLDEPSDEKTPSDSFDNERSTISSEFVALQNNLEAIPLRRQNEDEITSAILQVFNCLSQFSKQELVENRESVMRALATIRSALTHLPQGDELDLVCKMLTAIADCIPSSEAATTALSFISQLQENHVDFNLRAVHVALEILIAHLRRLADEIKHERECQDEIIQATALKEYDKISNLIRKAQDAKDSIGAVQAKLIAACIPEGCRLNSTSAHEADSKEFTEILFRQIQHLRVDELDLEKCVLLDQIPSEVYSTSFSEVNEKEGAEFTGEARWNNEVENSNTNPLSHSLLQEATSFLTIDENIADKLYETDDVRGPVKEECEISQRIKDIAGESIENKHAPVEINNLSNVKDDINTFVTASSNFFNAEVHAVEHDCAPTIYLNVEKSSKGAEAAPTDLFGAEIEEHKDPKLWEQGEQTLDGPKSILSAATGAFSACAEGHFDVAFWLSWLAERTNQPSWSHNAFSTFIFGSQILPGGVFGSELGTVLNELSQKFPDEPSNRIFLAAGLITPIIFCADKPSSVYALRDFAITGLPRLDELLSNAIDLGMNKAVSMTPFDVALAGVSTDHSKVLEELSVESSTELHKAKVAKMAFWPGECLLHAIYREGMPLYSLHEIVSTNNKTRLTEARKLLESISPDTLPDSYELAPGFVSGRYPLMIGPARTRFLRYVNTTLSLARRWVDRTEAYSRPVDNFRRSQIDEFRHYIRKSVPAVRAEIEDNIGRVPNSVDAALRCALFAVKRVAKIVAGDRLEEQRNIYTMLAPHPSVALDDDFMPLVGSENDLISLIEGGQKPSPQLAFEAALRRNEFVRARTLLATYDLEDRAQEDYDIGLEKACSEILSQIDDLETRVEDAYLLGELSEFDFHAEDSDEHQSSFPSQHAVRSEILGKLSSARIALSNIRNDDEPRVRDIMAKVEHVSKFTDKIKAAAQARMQERCKIIALAFPNTPDGQEDRTYFLQRFSSSTAAGDQVAAAEIIHQAEIATRRNERLTRTITDLCSTLREFGFAEQEIFNGLAQIELRLDEVVKFVQDRKSIWGLHFDKLGDTYAESAQKALESLNEARNFGSNDSVSTFLPILLSALGFETIGDARPRARSNEYSLYDYTLKFAPSCPVPSFGSNLKRKLTVLVLLRRFSDDETRDLIAQLNLKRTPFMAISIHPISTLMRHRLRALCAHEHLEMLSIDLVGILFVLSRQNRQQTVFEITLPFAYSQPYQMKGENVPEETFVGREKEVNSLLDIDGACIVFGGRQLGKSAILRHLTNKYHDPHAGHYIVYRDIDDLGAGAESYDKVRNTFWEYVANEISLSEFAELRSAASKGGKIESIVTSAIKEVFSKDASVRLTVLLDEADDLINLDAQHDFGLIKTIRGLMVDTNRRFKVVFAGLQSVQQFQRWKNHPFAQLGREIVIGPLPPDAAQRLVVTPMSALGFEFESSELILRIMSQVNYHPGLMQIFCHRLLERYYEKAARQKRAGGSVRIVSRDDLREVERTPSLIEDIRDRFDWTLDLDDRYKLLIYALVLSENPIEPRTASEFQKLGAYWWGAEFAAMDLASTRSLLEEMEGLGVLVRIDVDGSRTYQLRSPNLLRLLGNRDVIEQEMERLIAQQSRRKANPREFHSFQSGKFAHFSPFTMGQEAEMFSRPEAAGVTLIFGSAALGIARVNESISKVARAFGNGTEAWARKEVGEQFQDHIERFATEIVKFFRPRDRNHLYISVQAEAVTGHTSLFNAVRDIQHYCKSTCSKNSKGRVFIVGGPRALWNWLIDRRVNEDFGRWQHLTEITLQPWTDGAAWKGFEAAGIRNKAKQASMEIIEKTGGFQFLIEDIISECRVRGVSSADVALPLMEEKLTAMTNAEARDLFGISELPEELQIAIEAIFPLIIEQDKNGRSMLTRAGIGEVIGYLDVVQMNAVFQNFGRETAVDIFVQWLTLIGLIRGTSHSSDEFNVPDIVETLFFSVQ